MESQGYVLLSVSVFEYEKELSKIPVVREYSYMFPEDIPKFSPKREIKFSIEIVSGTG